MYRIRGVQEEKGLLWMALRMLLQKLLALLQEDHVQFFEIIVWRDQANAVVEGIRMLGQL